MVRIVTASVALSCLAACGVSETEIGGDSTASTEQDVRRNSPCNTVRCASGTHCEAKGKIASCVADAPACKQDSDCRLYDNYCDGCACDALPTTSTDPVCGGSTVTCFVQPCMGKVATCQAGTCVVSVQGTTGGGPKCGTKTCDAGDYCCNSSCSICAPRGAMCIQIACN